MRRLLVLFLAFAAAAVVAALGWKRSPPAAADRLEVSTTTPWEPIDGLSGVPTSYAESASGQAAVVDGVASLRKSQTSTWLKFVSGFSATRVEEAGGGIYLIGSVAEVSAGAPVLLRVLPTPSDVIPVPCEPLQLEIRGDRAAIRCARSAFFSVDGLRTLIETGAARDKSGVRSVSISPAGSVWILRELIGYQRVQEIACPDATPCGMQDLPVGIELGAASLGDSAEQSRGAGFLDDSRERVRSLLFVSSLGKDAPRIAVGPRCDEPHAAEASVVMPSRSTAFYLCAGRLFSTLDAGKTFRREETAERGEKVTALWGGDGWVAIVAGGTAQRRSVK